MNSIDSSVTTSLTKDVIEKMKEEIINVRFTDPDLVLSHCTLIKQYALFMDDSELFSEALFYEGDAYLTKKNFTRSIQVLVELIEYQKRVFSTSFLGKAHNDLAIISYSQCDYYMALEHYFNAMKYSEINKDHTLQAMLYNNIGATFLLLEDYKNALSFFNKCWSTRNKYMNESLKRFFSDERAALNLGICQFCLNQIQDAKDNLRFVESNVKPDEYRNLCLFIDFLGARIADITDEPETVKHYMNHLYSACEEYYNPVQFNNMLDMVDLFIKYDITKTEFLLKFLEKQLYLQYTEANHLAFLNKKILYYKQTKNRQKELESYQLYYEISKKKKFKDDQKNIQSLNNRLLLIREKKQYEELAKKTSTISNIILRDALTGLLNRYGLREMEQSLSTELKREPHNISVALIDIDNFKDINDTYGHIVGDDCLTTLAKAIQTLENSHITGIRYGGDEFLILGNHMNREEFEQMIKNLLKVVKESSVPTRTEKKAIHFSISIGAFSQYSSASFSLDHFIEQADQALYQIKKTKKGSCSFYEER